MNKLVVRVEITPENARSYGYIWWQDGIYDPEAPDGVYDDLVELVEEGWILGQPAGRMGSDSAEGLYRPIEEEDGVGGSGIENINNVE